MAWIQHMITSMNDNGRMAVVLPKGVLYRKGIEGKIRKNLLEQDLIESVIGLGPNIFYGTQLAPCLLILRRNKEKSKKNKILIIDASDQIIIGKSQNYLEKSHIEKIFNIYSNFNDLTDFSRIVTLNNIKNNDYNLNISLYIERLIQENLKSHEIAFNDFEKAWESSEDIEENFKQLLKNYIQ